jgi:hypothetical protein
MTNVVEFPQEQEKTSPRQGAEPASTPRVESERYYPIVNSEECKFIETTGGAYRGFVDRQNGGREFQDFSTTRVAFYDEAQRKVIEAFIATDGTNEEDSNELNAPGDVVGYKLMIVRRTMSGEQLGSPEFIQIRASDAPSGQGIDDLRGIVEKLHERATKEVPNRTPAALREQLEETLRQQGWRTTPSG